MRRRRGLCALAAGAVALPAALAVAPALAAPVGAPDTDAPRGAPIAQSFLDEHGDNVSLVATPHGTSCVASRPLPIREALYRDAEGAVVPFDEVTRSPASSVQAIAGLDGPVAFRLQLKYPLDTARAITLETGAERLDLADAVEPSRDSLWLAGAAAEALAAAFVMNDAPLLRAHSAETGREITDRIELPAMEGLEACLETLETLEAAAAEARARGDAGAEDAEPTDALRIAEGTVADEGSEASELALAAPEPAEPRLPIPVAGVRVELHALQDPALRLGDEQLRGCRMRDIPEELYLGRVASVTGFFSQTQDVYVAFDEEGRLERAYIPGIFDSDLTPGANSARLSLAADSNVPDRANTVRGCLGDARLQAPICVYPGAGEGRYVLAECGVLGVSDGVDEPFLALGWGTPGGSGRVSNTPVRISSGPRFGPPGGGGGPFPPTVTPFPPPGPPQPPQPPLPPDEEPPHVPPETPDLPAVPLPAALWLLLGALASLPGLRALQRRQADA